MSMPPPGSGFEGELVLPGSLEAEVERFCSQTDCPAFVRRGQDVDHAMMALDARCREARREMLEMLHLRLRQWAEVATGPDDWSDQFGRPVAPLWRSSQAPAAPGWAERPGAARRRRRVARDLQTSVARFNRRWSRFLRELDVRRVNELIAGYNRYYLIEKEVVVGSDRVASRLFRPIPPVSPERLLERFPLLPDPRSPE